MEITDQLVQYYRWLREYGLNDSHSGNASVRKNERYWITPTGACADTMQTADLVKCDIDRAPETGASLDAALHRAVYLARPDASAILHSHGAHSVAMTFSGNEFTPPDFEGAYYFGSVPILDINYEDYVTESPTVVANALAASRIVVVRGHGVYTCGRNLDEAYKWTCTLELSARTAFLAQQAGTL